ncbi:MAG: hypothetical protein FJX76_20510 [Armatimonadetes bacterium]|nr:hypothetical protein [Armatimonadota bacterium]
MGYERMEWDDLGLGSAGEKPTPCNDPGMISEMGLGVDGMFVGRDGTDGLILQVWSRRLALNASLPIAGAVLQDARERHPAGILSSLARESFFRIPEGSPMAAALLDELGVDVQATWGLQWRNGALTPGSVTVRPPAPPRPALVDSDRFFQMQEVLPRSHPLRQSAGKVSSLCNAAHDAQSMAPVRSVPATPPLRSLPPLPADLAEEPYMQYLLGDLEAGDLMCIEVEDSDLQLILMVEGPSRVSERKPRDLRVGPRKTLYIGTGKCISLLLRECRVTVFSAAGTGDMSRRCDPIADAGTPRATSSPA